MSVTEFSSAKQMGGVQTSNAKSSVENIQNVQIWKCTSLPVHLIRTSRCCFHAMNVIWWHCDGDIQIWWRFMDGSSIKILLICFAKYILEEMLLLLCHWECSFFFNSGSLTFLCQKEVGDGFGYKTRDFETRPIKEAAFVCSLRRLSSPEKWSLVQKFKVTMIFMYLTSNLL